MGEAHVKPPADEDKRRHRYCCNGIDSPICAIFQVEDICLPKCLHFVSLPVSRCSELESYRNKRRRQEHEGKNTDGLHRPPIHCGNPSDLDADFSNSPVDLAISLGNKTEELSSKLMAALSRQYVCEKVTHSVNLSTMTM